MNRKEKRRNKLRRIEEKTIRCNRMGWKEE